LLVLTLIEHELTLHLGEVPDTPPPPLPILLPPRFEEDVKYDEALPESKLAVECLDPDPAEPELPGLSRPCSGDCKSIPLAMKIS
jgi:hypothetical protein